MKKKVIQVGAQISVVVVALIAGVVGYFAAAEIVALIVGSILGIGVGWIPGGTMGIVVRSIIAIFMAFYCGKNYKHWLMNKLAES